VGHRAVLLDQSAITSTHRAGQNDELPARKLDAIETPKAGLTGRRLLVIEDEPLVAMDNTATLESVGATVVGPVSSINDALRVISETQLDGALLDGNLHGKPVDEIAGALARLGVPFIFVSGYGRETLPRAFANAPLLGKPFSPEQLVKSVVALLRNAASVPPLTRASD
jgi:DNA-binding response OmpR family regulator